MKADEAVTNIFGALLGMRCRRPETHSFAVLPGRHWLNWRHRASFSRYLFFAFGSKKALCMVMMMAVDTEINKCETIGFRLPKIERMRQAVATGTGLRRRLFDYLMSRRRRKYWLTSKRRWAAHDAMARKQARLSFALSFSDKRN